MMNQPISPAVLMKEPEVLYVVIPTPRTLGQTRNVMEIGQTVLSTWTTASLVSQLKRLRLVNGIRKDAGIKRLPVCVIRPNLDLNSFGVDLLSFGLNVSELVKDGREAAYAKLNKFDIENEETWYDVG